MNNSYNNNSSMNNYSRNNPMNDFNNIVATDDPTKKEFSQFSKNNKKKDDSMHNTLDSKNSLDNRNDVFDKKPNLDKKKNDFEKDNNDYNNSHGPSFDPLNEYSNIPDPNIANSDPTKREFGQFGGNPEYNSQYNFDMNNKEEEKPISKFDKKNAFTTNPDPSFNQINQFYQEPKQRDEFSGPLPGIDQYGNDVSAPEEEQPMNSYSSYNNNMGMNTNIQNGFGQSMSYEEPMVNNYNQNMGYNEPMTNDYNQSMNYNEPMANDYNQNNNYYNQQQLGFDQSMNYNQQSGYNMGPINPPVQDQMMSAPQSNNYQNNPVNQAQNNQTNTNGSYKALIIMVSIQTALIIGIIIYIIITQINNG